MNNHIKQLLNISAERIVSDINNRPTTAEFLARQKSISKSFRKKKAKKRKK